MRMTKDMHVLGLATAALMFTIGILLVVPSSLTGFAVFSGDSQFTAWKVGVGLVVILVALFIVRRHGKII